MAKTEGEIRNASEVKRWPLLFRVPVSTWRKGNMVIAGDAAHPMLPRKPPSLISHFLTLNADSVPDQGQGGAQGIEDGVALGIALAGTTPEDVPARLEIYEQVRRNRASAIQILSNAGVDQTHLIAEELAKYTDVIPSMHQPSPEDYTMDTDSLPRKCSRGPRLFMEARCRRRIGEGCQGALS